MKTTFAGGFVFDTRLAIIDLFSTSYIEYHLGKYLALQLLQPLLFPCADNDLKRILGGIQALSDQDEAFKDKPFICFLKYNTFFYVI